MQFLRGLKQKNCCGCGGTTTTETKYTATEVIDLIDVSGTVNKDSKVAIEKARAAYNSLTEAQQKKVANYDKGLMNGESATQFMPNNKLSRAMLVTLLTVQALLLGRKPQCSGR